MDMVWSIFVYRTPTSLLLKIFTIPMYRALQSASDVGVGCKLSTGLFQYPRFPYTNSDFFGSHRVVSEYQSSFIVY